MTYLPFPEHWPVFSPKDRIADWLEMYVKVMQLDYWGSAPCRSARFDEDRNLWEVVVERNGEPVTLRPAHPSRHRHVGFPEAAHSRT
jgi:putative flavoprotein involved in K+ transport